MLDQFIPELGRYEIRVSHRAIEKALYDSIGLTGAAAAASATAGAQPGAAAAQQQQQQQQAREVEVAARRLLATALRPSPLLGAVRGEQRYKVGGCPRGVPRLREG